MILVRCRGIPSRFAALILCSFNLSVSRITLSFNLDAANLCAIANIFFLLLKFDKFVNISVILVLPRVLVARAALLKVVDINLAKRSLFTT